MKIDLSIVLPVYNESKFLVSQVESLISGLEKDLVINYEILLVENGSVDNSRDLCLMLKKKYRQISVYLMPTASYGQAIRLGMLNSVGKNVCVFNVDYFDIDFLKKAVKTLTKVDIAVGSKTLISSKDERGIIRSLITYLFNVVLRLTVNYPGSDTHGIKVFKNTKNFKAELHRTVSSNELFDTELIIRMVKSGLLLVELPVEVRELRPSRYSNLARIVKTLKDLATIIFMKIFGFSNPLNSALVVADDYGYSNEINKEILKYVRSGSVDVVSVLPNYVKQKQATLLKKQGVQVSAHLNFTEGRPVSKIYKVKSLVSGSGNFYSLPLFVVRYFLGMVNFNELVVEAEEQLKRLEKLGLTVSLYNSHQHIHLFPGINMSLESFLRNKNEKVRSYNSSKLYIRRHLIRYLVFVGIVWFGRKRFQEGRCNFAHGEFIIHPGTQFDY